MTTRMLAELADSCSISGRIEARDVQIIARDLLPDGVTGRGEAELLLAMERTVRERATEWDAFFVQTLVDYMLYVERPTGKITSGDADWLIAMIGCARIDGNLRELLVAIVREADVVDPRLAPLAYGTARPRPARAAVASSIGWLDSAGLGA